MDKAVGTQLNGKTQSLAEKAFRLLFLVIWTQYTILSFAIQIVRRLPIIGPLYEYVIPLAIIGLALLSLPYLLQRIRGVDVVFYFVCVIIVLGTLVLNDKNVEFIQKDLWRILGAALPMIFIGVSYSHENSKNDLFWASLLGVIAVFAYQIYLLSLGQELEADNMNTAYTVLPSVMYLVYWALEHKKLRHWLIASVSMLVMFLFGTRGPIVAELVFLLIGLLLSVFNRKSQFAKLFCFILFAAVIILVCSGDFLLNAAKYLSESFEEVGFSTRVFDRFIEGEISEGSGRDVLYNAVISAIREKPILGYGIMGDRPIVGIYVHNLFLEMWCHYGVIIGTVFLFAILAVPAAALIKLRKTRLFNFVLMLTCMVFVKLMVTGSYTTEAYLFLLLGICVGVFRSQKENPK